MENESFYCNLKRSKHKFYSVLQIFRAMKTTNENTRQDKIQITIAFTIIGLITIGVLLVAFGLFDAKQ